MIGVFISWSVIVGRSLVRLERRTRRSRSVSRRRRCPSRPSASLMSSPAQNPTPAPVRIAQRTPRSRSTRSIASPSCTSIGTEIALRRCGRFRVMVATWPSTSYEDLGLVGRVRSARHRPGHRRPRSFPPLWSRGRVARTTRRSLTRRRPAAATWWPVRAGSTRMSLPSSPSSTSIIPRRRASVWARMRSIRRARRRLTARRRRSTTITSSPRSTKPAVRRIDPRDQPESVPRGGRRRRRRRPRLAARGDRLRLRRCRLGGGHAGAAAWALADLGGRGGAARRRSECVGEARERVDAVLHGLGPHGRERRCAGDADTGEALVEQVAGPAGVVPGAHHARDAGVAVAAGRGEQRPARGLRVSGLQPDRAGVAGEEALVVVDEVPADAVRVGEVRGHLRGGVRDRRDRRARCGR